MPDASAQPDRMGRLWLALLVLAAIEVVGHFVILARVPADDDWRQAASFVRSQWRDRDIVLAAPDWSDPLLREHLGDVITFEMAGHSDLAGYDRLWALSIRGFRPREAPPGEAELDRAFGRVRVLRWRLPREPVLYDFVRHVADAQVVRVEGGVEHPCRWQASGRPTGGGLGAGPITPGARWQCDYQRSWLWVGATVNEDLDLRPRRCIWQHPSGPEPIRASFPDVPLGERFVLYGDVYYEHERDRVHGAVDVVVRVDGEEVGRMSHGDGDGFQRMEASTVMPDRRARGTVSIEVSAVNPDMRTFCWEATTRPAEVRR